MKKFLALALIAGLSAEIAAAKGKKGAPVKTEKATLAGGCFWGMEELIRKIPGVLNTVVGYTGGNAANPSYEVVKTGKSGHAETVEIEFDPAQIKYEDLLLQFFRMHDPTTLNRQGNDIGTQYRSAIFYHSPQQKLIAETVKNRVDASGAWKKPVATVIEEATPFYKAEDYHQDYLEKNPGGYTCHWIRDLKF
jgi:methionine-S-sulfoxide reductase